MAETVKIHHFTKPNCFRDIYEKLLSDTYVLFLVSSAIFFEGWKLHTQFLLRIPQGRFIPTLVLIGQVVSEDKSFEKLLTKADDDISAHMTFG